MASAAQAGNSGTSALQSSAKWKATDFRAFGICIQVLGFERQVVDFNPRISSPNSSDSAATSRPIAHPYVSCSASALRILGKIDAIAKRCCKAQIAFTDTSNAIALVYILDLGQENYQSQFMSTYNEVLTQVQSLTSDEQLQLLEELAALVRRKVTSEHQNHLQEMQGIGVDKWRGFLPKRVDALEFQRSLRQEWGE